MYTGTWTYAFTELVSETTFDNNVVITRNNETVSTSLFDGGHVFMGQVLFAPSITATLTASTSGDSWDVKTYIDSTISPCEYAYYSVMLYKDDDTYEVKNGIVYIKSKFGGE